MRVSVVLEKGVDGIDEVFRLLNGYAGRAWQTLACNWLIGQQLTPIKTSEENSCAIFLMPQMAVAMTLPPLPMT